MLPSAARLRFVAGLFALALTSCNPDDLTEPAPTPGGPARPALLASSSSTQLNFEGTNLSCDFILPESSFESVRLLGSWRIFENCGPFLAYEGSGYIYTEGYFLSTGFDLSSPAEQVTFYFRSFGPGFSVWPLDVNGVKTYEQPIPESSASEWVQVTLGQLGDPLITGVRFSSRGSYPFAIDQMNLDVSPSDADSDGIADGDDICPLDPTNDADADGICIPDDVCPVDPDNDADNDGICGDVDLCVGSDSQGDADGDGICDDLDNCRLVVNTDQADSDGDGIGDLCDTPTNPLYTFTGFLQPVDNPNVATNTAKAGSAIPVKFKLGGNQGLEIFREADATGAYPKFVSEPCPGSTTYDPIEVTTISPSGLTYDTSTDTYTYVWKSDKGWAGKCGRFQLGLDDGSDHHALFKFTR